MKKEENKNLTASETPETEAVSQNDSEELGEKALTAVENGETETNPAQKSPANRQNPQNRPWLSYVITAAVLAALTLLIAWAYKGYSHADASFLLSFWGDSFAIPGAVCLGFGILVWASNGGAFDIFAYGGRRFIHMFKKDVRDHKYPTYYDYRESRKQKKRSFLFMIIVGGAYLTVGVVLMVVGSQLRP